MVDIGFIGLGHMGFPMARRLIDAGHDVIAFDIRGEALDGLVALGARPAASPKQVADLAETVMASLPSPHAAIQVATGAAGVVEGGRVRRYVDLSTIGSATAVQIHGVLAERNIVAIDSPVSGGVGGAENGKLAMMVSSPHREFDALRPMLETLGRPMHVGEQPGSAQTMKLVNNILAATVLVATSEVVVMGAKSGLDPSVMIDVLNAGSGATRPAATSSRGRSSPHIRLRLRHRADGQGRSALPRRGESNRCAGRDRRSRGSTLGSHAQR